MPLPFFKVQLFQYNTFHCKMHLFIDKQVNRNNADCRLIHRKNKSLHWEPHVLFFCVSKSVKELSVSFSKPK